MVAISAFSNINRKAWKSVRSYRACFFPWRSATVPETIRCFQSCRQHLQSIVTVTVGFLVNFMAHDNHILEISDFNPEIVNTEIFDAEQLQNVDSDIQSFFLQLAGHCGRLCDEDSGDLAKIYGFLIEAMRINSSDTSILCGWLKAMEIVISKHTRKQLSSEILSHIHQCLSDKRYFVSKTSLSLVEQLMDNSFANRDLEYHIRAVEFLLSSAVQDFKNSIHDTSSLQVMLSLMEKMISLGKSNSCNSEVPLSWMSLFSQEVVDNINQTLSKLLRGNSLEIDRILQVLYGMLSMKGCNLVALPVEEIDKILKNLLLTDDKTKALYVAEWMMRNPSFHHLREQLERLCLSPLMHEVGDCQEMTSLEEYHFVNSSFDSEILCLVFKIVGRCEVQQPFKVFDTCLRFLKEICFDVDARSRHPSKCIRVCLEALNSLASKIAGTPSNDHKSILVNLLDVFHEDHLTVSRIFKIIENVSASFTSDEESSSKLFASLSRLIKNVKWDTRDSVITFIRHLYTLNSESRSAFSQCRCDTLHDRLSSWFVLILMWTTLNAKRHCVEQIAAFITLLFITCSLHELLPVDDQMQSSQNGLAVLGGRGALRSSCSRGVSRSTAWLLSKTRNRNGDNSGLFVLLNVLFFLTGYLLQLSLFNYINYLSEICPRKSDPDGPKRWGGICPKICRCFRHRIHLLERQSFVSLSLLKKPSRRYQVWLHHKVVECWPSPRTSGIGRIERPGLGGKNPSIEVFQPSSSRCFISPHLELLQEQTVLQCCGRGRRRMPSTWFDHFRVRKSFVKAWVGHRISGIEESIGGLRRLRFICPRRCKVHYWFCGGEAERSLWRSCRDFKLWAT